MIVTCQKCVWIIKEVISQPREKSSNFESSMKRDKKNDTVFKEL